MYRSFLLHARSPLSRTHHTPAPRPDSAHNPTPGDMATGFIGIAWLRNSTVVHEFPQLQHENFSKTFILSPTEVNDYTLYQADIYTVDGRILTVDFVVGEFGKFSSLRHLGGLVKCPVQKGVLISGVNLY